MKIIPLKSYILVTEKKDEQTDNAVSKSGIILSTEAAEISSKVGQVFDLGRDYKGQIKRKDIVMFRFGDQVGVDQFIVNEDDIIAICQ